MDDKPIWETVRYVAETYEMTIRHLKEDLERLHQRIGEMDRENRALRKVLRDTHGDAEPGGEGG